MKLFYSPASPYARKVVIAASELGIALEVEKVGVSPIADNPQMTAANPLGKIPTLVLKDGTTLHDSRVITDYFDSLTPRSLIAQSGAERYRVLTETSIADGLLDAALLVRYEAAMRPEALRWPEWIAGQMGKIRRALDAFETAPRHHAQGLTIADIAVACGLGYLDFRFPEETWREGRPRLAAFHAAFAQRPDWVSSDPAI